MRSILRSAALIGAWFDTLRDDQRETAQALRDAVLAAEPGLETSIKWGNLVYLSSGPVIVIRAEARRVLFGFWRGQRLRKIEPRLKPGGKYEMATIELVEGSTLGPTTVRRLTRAAVALNRTLGSPTNAAKPSRRK